MRLYKRTASPNWYVDWIDARGVVQRRSTGVPHAQRGSQRVAQEAATKIVAEEEAKVVVERSISLRTAVHRFLDDAETRRLAGDEGLRPGTQQLYATRLATFVAWCETQKVTALGQVNKKLIEDYARARNQLVRSARQELTPLGSLFRFTYGEGYEGSPDSDIVKSVDKKHLRKSAKSKRAITEEQAAKLLEHIRTKEPPFWYRFVCIILETAMRHREVLRLRWDMIHFDMATRTGHIVLPAEMTKGNEERVLPFGTELYAILADIPRKPGSELVFPSRVSTTKDPEGAMGKVNTGWAALRERAGFPKLKIHDLRHTWNALARDSGLPEADRMAVSGHSDVRTSRHYGAGGTESLGDRVRQHSPLARLTGSTYKSSAPGQEEIITPKKREKSSRRREK